MAVIVDFKVPDATPAQLYEVEQRTVARGQALGKPPYPGCMFIAVTAEDNGFRFVSAWRSERDFHSVLDAILGPDLASVGLAVTDVQAATAVSMAIPGDQ